MTAPVRAPAAEPAAPAPVRVLLIEDSIHYQNLVGLLLRQQFPTIELHMANDGIAGLAMAGQLQPQVLVERAIDGESDSYPYPWQSAGAGAKNAGAYGILRCISISSHAQYA